MKKILMATVAAIPLIAVAALPASAQEINKQKQQGASQTQEHPGAQQQQRASEPQGRQPGAQTEGRANQGQAGKTARQNEASGNASQNPKDKSQQRASGQERGGQTVGQGESNTNNQLNKNKPTKGQANSKQNGREQTQGNANNAQNNKSAQDNAKNRQEPAKNQVGQGQTKQNNANQAQKQQPQTSGQSTRSNEQNASQRPNGQNAPSGNETRGQAENRTGGGGNEGRVTLNEEQRSRVEKDVLSGRDVPRENGVNFSMNVGTEVPSRVRVVAVPQTLIDIHPEWRGDEYFVVRDDIIIVDHGHRIVAMVPVGGSSVGEARSTTTGSGGGDIRQIQEVLIQKGYYHGSADGRFGPETRDALMAFQRSQGMQATGQIDVRTSQALGISGRSGTEGRATDQSNQRQGQQPQGRPEPNNNNGARPSTSGQAGPSQPSGARDQNERNGNRNEPQSNRPSTSGQAGAPSSPNANNNAPDKNRPSTSGQATRPSNNAAGQSNGANDQRNNNQRKQPQ